MGLKIVEKNFKVAPALRDGRGVNTLYTLCKCLIINKLQYI